jgi:imidazolonepropionase-like amidohydrolase
MRLFALGLVLMLGSLTVDGAEGTSTYAFVNGKWFDGSVFKERSVYASDGRFTFEVPEVIDQTIDLEGKYVVPPFGESHTHTLAESPARNAEFLEHGIFYATIQAWTVSGAARHRAQFSGPRSVDSRIAAAGITASDGHPMQIGMRFLEPDAIDGEWMHIVDSGEDLRNKWDAVLASNTDFVKTFLINSDRHAELKADESVTMRYRGLAPVLLPEIVRRSHAASLKVSCHVRTAIDFRTAVAAGVDELAHMPGFAIGPESDDDLDNARLLAELDDPARFMLNADDARKAADSGVVVDTTLGYRSRALSGDLSDEHRERLKKMDAVRADVHRSNLRVLHEAGVRLSIGSDMGEGTSRNEALYIHELGVFDNLTLLRLWAVTTPQSIFPERKIGQLDEGFEASFLALEANPLRDFIAVTRIAYRFKQGVPLD